MERSLFSSPTRPEYLASSRLNPVNLLPYEKFIAVSINDTGTLLTNTATETSIFYLCPATDFKLDPRVSYLASSDQTLARLVFARNMLQPGNVLQATTFGWINGNTDGVELTVSTAIDEELHVNNYAGAGGSAVLAPLDSAQAFKLVSTCRFHRTSIYVQSDLDIYTGTTLGWQKRMTSVSFTSASLDYSDSKFSIRTSFRWDAASATNELVVQTYAIDLW